MPNMADAFDLRDALDLRDTPYGVQHWQDQGYRQQGLRNVLGSAAGMQQSKRDNEYLQETLRLAEQASMSLRAAMGRVTTTNHQRLMALKEATAIDDGKIVMEMRESIRKKMGDWSKELPDELAEIFRPLARTTQAVKGQSTGAALWSAVPTAADKVAGIQTAVNQHTAGFVTNFEATAVALAAPYVEQLFDLVLNKIDEKRGQTQRNHFKEQRKAITAAINLTKAVPLIPTLAKVVEITLPDSLHKLLVTVANPADAFLGAVVVKFTAATSMAGIMHAAANVHTIAVPFTKLVQPLMSIVTLLHQYPKIDGMHALHQRLPANSPCSAAAFQIVDKWETGLVNKIGGGHQVYAFITAVKNLYNAGKPAANNPAEVLWHAAQHEAAVSRGDRDSALLVLATLFGDGNARNGIDKAVAAIVSDKVGGIAKIKSLI
ncbi:MAG TPA: hypothetical protein VL522_15030 [Bordetella sp.]|nr:hypothetical protein [Bordetella sp.]